MRYILLCFLLAALTLNAKETEDNDQMVVRLATEKKLMPLYLTKFYVEKPDLDEAYIQKLRGIFSFDLGNNGMTEVASQSQELDQMIQSLPFDQFGDLKNWKNKNIFYAVKVKVVNRELNVRVISINGGMVKGVDNLPLTGDITQDRKQIHKLSDSIYRILFGKEGIATTHILFTRRIQQPNKQEWTSEVWEMDYDGANAHQVTKSAGYAVTPFYAPTPKGQLPSQFYYVSYKTGQPKIYIASLRDGLSRRFSTLRGNQLLPAISRKHDKMAFISDFTGNPDIYVQAISKIEEQKPYQVYTSYRSTQGSPSFNPEGDKIAFVSNKDGTPKIYVLDIPEPGTRVSQLNPTLITKYQRESTAPSWSPDGTKLAYSAMTKGVRQIWIYDFDKKEEIQVTSGPENKENPTWAPNSLHLSYNTVTNNGSEVYIMNLNQLKPVKISSGNGEKRFPNWEPRNTF